MTGFNVGQTVHHRGLKKRATIVSQESGGRYRIALGSITMLCAAADLEVTADTADTPAAANRWSPGRDEQALIQSYRKDRRSIESVDLHGMTVREAEQVIVNAIDKAVLIGSEQIAFIHGHGSGRVKDALYALLPTIPAVHRFEQDPFNRGKTWVYL